MKNFLSYIMIIILPFVFFGCVTRSVVKKNYDFSKIKKVAVSKFSGEGGGSVSDEFIRQLLSTGLTVVESGNAEKTGADAVISGTVQEFNPSNKLLVFKDKGNIIISDRVIPISGTSVMSRGNAFGMDDANVYTVSASVSVSVKMTDSATGEVVWADSSSYEGLDINTAVGFVVSSLLKSIRPYWKELKK